MKTTVRAHRKRNRTSLIKTVQETAPWMKVSLAASESGINENQIRGAFPLRRFGNADYVSPGMLNDWILKGELPETNSAP